MMDDILKQIKAGEVSGVQFKERILDKYGKQSGNDNGIDLLEWMRSNGYQNPFIIMTSSHIVSLSRLWLIYAALT